MTDGFLAAAAMFWSAFLAATFLPGGSEVVLAAGLIEKSADPWLLIGLATVGNTLGSLVNWACGRFLMAWQDRRWFPVKRDEIEHFTAFFRRWGVWTLLFAFVPVAGDALTLVAGIARVDAALFMLLVGLGKLGRYLVVAAGVLSWPWI
ncbi:YqaA family protein [Jiella sonneratiae]|uniref:DedA family protein n=1 Tax=Jiella sonneratiae TaxID=2816856 RepID=A0ABS3J5E7_9HYPH|nr:YqaA family protein [Jiella sonneratiae]MBO0904178.1 DedA family protein [Jiella sonneratiae]